MQLAPETLALDRQAMLQKVIDSPLRASQTYRLGQTAEMAVQKLLSHPPAQILLCGMGGSGSCGDMLQALSQKSQIPIMTCKASQLPAWVSPQTLVIGISYSGNTAETLACLQQAKARGALRLGLSSGGELARQAQAEGFPLIQIPGGLLPRAALFDMLYALLGAFQHCQFLGLQAAEIAQSLEWLKALSSEWSQESQALKLAQSLQPLNPVLWGISGQSEAAALRWRNQLSENAKTLSSLAILPELNHNEVVPMCAQHHSRLALLYFTLESVVSQVDVPVLELVGEHVAKVLPIHAQGANLTERLLYLIYLGDFVSVYLALLKGIDPSPIAAIDELKRRMS